MGQRSWHLPTHTHTPAKLARSGAEHAPPAGNVALPQMKDSLPFLYGYLSLNKHTCIFKPTHTHTHTHACSHDVWPSHARRLCLTDDLPLRVTEPRRQPLRGVIVSRMTCYDGEEHCGVSKHTHTHTRSSSCMCLLSFTLPCLRVTRLEEATEWEMMSFKERKQAGKSH